MNMSNEIAKSEYREIVTKNKLFCQFDEEDGVLLIDVKRAPLTADDFAAIADIIDPYYAKHGELKGIIINSKKFPYWKGVPNRMEYVAFAQNNHQKFGKAALGIGGFFVQIVARIAKGRVHPEVKIFGHDKIAKAQEWILGYKL
jgi:hypothetical protein